MSDGGDTTRASEAWARNLEQHLRGTRWTRRVMRRLPNEPRCKFCFAPFAGSGAHVARLAGRRPSRKNPNLCDVCVEKGPPGGFETEGGVLFADVRGFTAYSEERSPSEVAETMDRFYAAATRVLVKHDAVIDKLVGDEVMALFWPVLMDGSPCPAMVHAGEELLRAVGYGNGDAPWLPLGVGIDFGRLHIGNVGPPGMQDFTALGDVVNTAARLQAHADAGQILVSERVYRVPGRARVVGLTSRNNVVREALGRGMYITTIGRGSVAAGLARLWEQAGHEATALGREGGDASA